MNAAIIPAQDINTQVMQQVSAIRSGKRPEYRALDQAISKSPEAVLKALAPYRSEHEKPLSMRREIVLMLMDGLADPQAAIRNSCVEYLSQCNRQDLPRRHRSVSANCSLARLGLPKTLFC